MNWRQWRPLRVWGVPIPRRYGVVGVRPDLSNWTVGVRVHIESSGWRHLSLVLGPLTCFVECWQEPARRELP